VTENKQPKPGVSRENRVSDEGLERLRKQLSSGPKMSQMVLRQWLKRYGEEARAVMKQFGIELSDK